MGNGTLTTSPSFWPKPWPYNDTASRLNNTHQEMNNSYYLVHLYDVMTRGKHTWTGITATSLNSFHFMSAVGAVVSSQLKTSSWSCGLIAIHLQILSTGMHQLCGRWPSVIHIHRQCIWQDLCRYGRHNLNLSGCNLAETTCDDVGWNLAARH